MDNNFYFTVITLSCFLLKGKGRSFLDIHCDNLVGLLEVKTTSVCCPCSPHSHTSQHSVFSSSPELSFKCFYQYTTLVASVPGKKISAGILDSSVSLIFKVTVFPVASVFCWKKLFIFSLFSFSLLE